MNLYNAIYSRRSTRTFENRNLSDKDIETIKNVLSKYQSLKGPFESSFEIIFKLNTSKVSGSKKIGTYGFLKNVPAFIGGVCESNIESIVDFGYVFEHIILHLTSLGFGTCWLGGTFKRKDYQERLESNQIIPAISPVGYIANRRALIDKILRSRAQSDNRYTLDKIVFDSNLNPYPIDLDNKIVNCLHLVQKAPSASNKQPWRIVIDIYKNEYSFYIARTPNYASFLKYDIQALDIGIAIAHFEIGIKNFNFSYTRSVLDSPILKDGWDYITTIHIK